MLNFGIIKNSRHGGRFGGRLPKCYWRFLPELLVSEKGLLKFGISKAATYRVTQKLVVSSPARRRSKTLYDISPKYYFRIQYTRPPGRSEPGYRVGHKGESLAREAESGLKVKKITSISQGTGKAREGKFRGLAAQGCFRLQCKPDM